MAQYPDNIFTPRETENLPGIVYNPTNKRQMYSEDFQNLGAEINAIEETLGENLSNIGGEVVDWSASLNRVGWVGSGGTTWSNYTKIGKLVTIMVIIGGTSNSANAHFTLPFAPNIPASLFVPIRIVNNNGIAVGNILLNPASTLVRCGANISGTGNFFASNSKAIHLTLSYFTT